MSDTNSTFDLSIGNTSKVTVTVPVPFKAGHTLTAAEAATLSAAYFRQFTNNQNALWKALEDKAAKGETVTFPTADQLAIRFTGNGNDIAPYAPQVGGGPRMGSLEKLRLDAAWKFSVARIMAHNEDVKTGGVGLVKAHAGKAMKIMRKGDVDKNETAEQFAARREAFCRAMLESTNPVFVDGIQAELDKLQAERGKDTSTGDVVVATGADSLE